jgi:protein SCO1
MARRFTRRIFFMAIAGLAAGGATVLPATVTADTIMSYLYRAPLRWTDDTGKSVALADWQGRPVILTMAYSSCRRTCSTTMLRLQEIQRVLDVRGKNAEFIVVSYDAEGDGPRAWMQYRQTRNLNRDNWHFLTGNKADTRRFAHLLGFDYWFMESHVVHEFKIVVLDDKGVVSREIGIAPEDFERLF